MTTLTDLHSCQGYPIQTAELGTVVSFEES